MSFFQELLQERNLARHDNRALGRYNLTVMQFNALKEKLESTYSLTDVDNRDCTLYFAFWWKWCYNGSIPSKNDVFNSIGGKHSFGDEEFYKAAINGAQKLGITWIKKTYSLYFRTLLLQGGLPVKHVVNNKNAYSRFLDKLLRINPSSIEEFSNDIEITSLLPHSSRNGEVYESCLDLVRAIISEDEEYLSLFNEDNDLKSIKEGLLRVKRECLTHHSSGPKFKTFWILELNGDAKIKLHVSAPNLSEKYFSSQILKKESAQDFEYKFYYEGQFLCKYVRTANNQYKAIIPSKQQIFWDGSLQRSELYVVSSSGKRYDCAHLMSLLPSAEHPTLWINHSESSWVLQKGSNTSQETALALFPESIPGLSGSPIKIAGLNMEYLIFRDSIQLNETLVFKTSFKKLDWIVFEQKPEWLKRSNFKVVEKKPMIHVYDDEGYLVKDIKKRWKLYGDSMWQEWSQPFSKGLIEIELEVEGVKELDYVYNITDFDILFRSRSSYESKLQVENLGYNFSVKEDEYIGAIINQNEVFIKRKRIDFFPHSVHGHLKVNGQPKGLIFELHSPFSGIEIIDVDKKIISNGSDLHVSNLYGYRIVSSTEEIEVKIFNTVNRSIILRSTINESVVALIRLQEMFLQLLSLSDPMDGQSKVVLELSVGNGQSKTYTINRYEGKIIPIDQSQSIIRFKKWPGENMYNIAPLVGPEDNFEILEPSSIDEDTFSFEKILDVKQYVVYTAGEIPGKLMPFFIQPHGVEVEEIRKLRHDRIDQYIADLLIAGAEDAVWDRLYMYYQTCVCRKLSFSTFDIFRACSQSPRLLAKLFVYLCSKEDEQFIQKQYRALEQDLGFFFHWIAGDDWNNALIWIRDFQLVEKVLYIYVQQHPVERFNMLSQFISTNQRNILQIDFVLRTRFHDVRSTLGERILNEIPVESPNIPTEFINILPLPINPENVRLLISSPLSVALAMSGKADCIWGPKNKKIRRHIKYCYHLTPEWYADAIIYSLIKL